MGNSPVRQQPLTPEAVVDIFRKHLQSEGAEQRSEVLLQGVDGVTEYELCHTQFGTHSLTVREGRCLRFKMQFRAGEFEGGSEGGAANVINHPDEKPLHTPSTFKELERLRGTATWTEMGLSEITPRDLQRTAQVIDRVLRDLEAATPMIDLSGERI